MTWESTGEVRRPEKGEYYLCRHSIYNNVEQAKHEFAIQEVIMRPVEEPKKVKEWEVVIGGFECQVVAQDCRDWLENEEDCLDVEVRPVYE